MKIEKIQFLYPMFLMFIILFLLEPSLNYCQEKPPEKPDGYSSTFTLKIAYFLGTLDLVETEFPVPEDIKEYKDIIYKTVDSTELKLDIYHRKDISQDASLLVFIHGGGWKKGKKHDYLRYLVDFAEKGFVTATVQYRLVGNVEFPGQVLDVKNAIIWLIENGSKYHIDAKNIAIVGGSAGGHLALMVGYTSGVPEFFVDKDSLITNSVKAIVDIYGPTDLTTEYARGESSVINLLGKSYNDDPQLYKNASPINYVTIDDPPTLIFQGTLDELVPFIQSDMLESKLKNIGVPVEYHLLEGWPHTMDLAVEVNEYFQYYMKRFFTTYLNKEPK